MTDSCPDVADLRQFLAAGLGPESESKVSDHLEVCSTCRGRVHALPGGTGWSERHSRAETGASDGRASPPVGLERIGEFRIIREIGRGGMGVVYEAEQTSLGRRVALKILSAFGLLDRTLVGRFEREAHAAAGLHHTNIVPVHGAGEERGLHYYAMEFIDGQGLDQIIRNLRAESVDRTRPDSSAARTDSGSSTFPSPTAGSQKYYHVVAKLCLQVADGLAYAHAHGVIHRDIKPSNLLLDGNSTLWIADFGLARSEGSNRLTQTGDVLGTVGYMAPERFRGVSDEGGDIYGLGITLYEILTLCPAFHDEDRHLLMKKVLDEEPPAPRKIDPLIPADLETIVLKAIQKDPEVRYRKASLLADDLRCFLLDRPIRARRATLFERTWRWCRRNRLVASLAAGIGVLSIAVAGASWHSWNQSEARRLADLTNESEKAIWEGRKLLDTGHYDKALVMATRALELQPSHGARLLEARILFELGRLRECAELLLSLLQENPDDGAAHYLLAIIYRGSDEERSEHHRRKAENLLKDKAEVYQLRAWTETLSESLKWLDKALKLDPGHYSSLKARALAHFALRNYEKMENDARAAAAKRPADAFNRSLMAISKARRGKLEEALVDLDQAIEMDSVDLGFYKQRRKIRRLLREHEAELEDARRIADLEPDDPTNKFYLVVALLANELVDEAKALYAEISGRSRRDKQWLYNALGMQVFEDAAAELDHTALAPDGSEFIRGLHNHRKFYEEMSSKARRVATNAFKASWSPDGSRLVYDSVILHELSLDAPTGRERTTRRSVRVVDIGTEEDRLVAENGKDASWSPDGKWITFVREPRFMNEALQEVFIVSPDGNEERKLAGGGYPTWSHDPTRVFFHSRELDMLCEVDVDDPDAKPRPLCPCAYPYPAVSPDGRFFSMSSGGELQIVEIESNEVRSRWRPPLSKSRLLTEWSPDGREVSLGAIVPDNTGLWVFDRESENARLVVRGPATLGAWSRDGQRFAMTIRGKIVEIWVAERDQLATTESDEFPPGQAYEERLRTLAKTTEGMVERSPDDPAVRRIHAQILESLKRHDEAAAAFQAAHERSARIVSDDLESAARNLELSGNLAGAIETLDEALRLPNRKPRIQRKAHALRRGFLPHFVSYESIDKTLRRLVGVALSDLRYHPGKTEPPPDWKEPDFDDSSWLVGKKSLGYGRSKAATILEDMKGNYTAVYLRHEFRLRNPDRLIDYRVDVVANDGFVAFLNGVEIGRRRTGKNGEAIRHDDLATAPTGRMKARALNIPRERLRRGTNVVAVIGLNSDRDSSIFFLRCWVRARWPTKQHPHQKDFDEFFTFEDGADPKLSLKQEYLRARRLQRKGEYRAALKKLESVIARDRAHPEPYLATAECFRDLGEIEDARARIREALERKDIRRDGLWPMWWHLSAVDAAKNSRTILEDLPADVSGFGRDLRESLLALEESRVLRINCGGGRYTDPDGSVWLADRFFNGGFALGADIESHGQPPRFSGEISGTDDDPLYRADRWFNPDYGNASRCAYLIPLTTGKYRVTMHFVETHERRPKRRVFGVLIEDQPAEERLDILSEVDFASPVTREATVDVLDGFLDVELLPIRGEPKVSAIEIHRIE